jgi:hypothetical protein
MGVGTRVGTGLGAATGVGASTGKGVTFGTTLPGAFVCSNDITEPLKLR